MPQCVLRLSLSNVGCGATGRKCRLSRHLDAVVPVRIMQEERQTVEYWLEELLARFVCVPIFTHPLSSAWPPTASTSFATRIRASLEISRALPHLGGSLFDSRSIVNILANYSTSLCYLLVI